MAGDRAEAHVLLDLGREVDDYAQVPRDPAHGFVHPLSQLLQAQPLAAQYVQQPALLQRRGFRRAALAAVQQQGVVVLEVPERRTHRVRAQALETTQAFEAIDDQVRALCLHHDHRHLLALLSERGQQASLGLGASLAQVLVAAIKLVKFQVHGAPLPSRAGAGGMPGREIA